MRDAAGLFASCACEIFALDLRTGALAMAKVGGTGLARYRASKGTLTFALDEPIPTTRIARVVPAPAAEIRG